MIKRQSIVGVVLAGGLGRRMGGEDKALLEVGVQSLVARAGTRLGPQVSKLIINANGDLSRLSLLGVPVIGDTLPGFHGPLAGVLSALRWVKREAPECTHVATVSTDTLFFPPDLVQALAEGLSGQCRSCAVAAAVSRGRVHPVMALWSVSVADDIEAALAQGERTVVRLQERFGLCRVSFDDIEIGGELVDPFFNVNTPDELSAARVLVERELPKVIGIVGWKNSGKTTLAVGLIQHFTRAGLRVGSVKHSHHDVVEVEDPSADSERHRQAGAVQVALVTPSRSGFVPDLVESSEPSLVDILRGFRDVDVVIVEGFKAAPIAKIEVRRAAQGEGRPLAETDANVIAIASDHPTQGHGRRVLDLNDVIAIADEAASRVGLRIPF